MKTIFITGGAKGIGSNIVQEFAKMGYNVFFTYNQSENKATELKSLLTDKGYNVDNCKADVTNEEQVSTAIKLCIKKYQKIDILVNNAGISYYNLLQDTNLEEWNKVINTNLTSAFLTCKEVIPYMLKNKDGLIINISSMWGITGASCEVAYSASKAGLDGLTKALAKELGPSNIRVNSIAPGIIDTDMNKNIDKAVLKELKEETPLEKMGNSFDISKCIKWLAEDEFTTGQVISINGGYVI